MSSVISAGISLETTDIRPLPPRAMMGSASASSPERTTKSSGKWLSMEGVGTRGIVQRDFHDAQLFVSAERGVLTGRAAGHEEINSRINLAAYQPVEGRFVERKIAPKRSDQRGAASCKHFASSVPLEQNLAKFKPALFADHPFGRGERAARKAFSAARGVAQRNGVGRRIETNFVGAGMSAGPVRAYIHSPVRIGLFHLFHQFQQRSARRVFFGGVMNFPGPRSVLLVRSELPRRFATQTQKDINSDGKVWTPYHSRTGPFHSRFGAIHLIGPPRRADDCINARSREPLDIRQNRRRNREIHGDVDAAKRSEE